MKNHKSKKQKKHLFKKGQFNMSHVKFKKNAFESLFK